MTDFNTILMTNEDRDLILDMLGSQKETLHCRLLDANEEDKPCLQIQHEQVSTALDNLQNKCVPLVNWQNMYALEKRDNDINKQYIKELESR